MKKLQNNQTNYLQFALSGENTLDIVGVLLKQLGSDIEIPIAALSIYSDCFITEISISLDENKLQNANYVMQVVSGNGDVLFTCNVLVEGNTDSSSAYVVFDDREMLDNIGEIP